MVVGRCTTSNAKFSVNFVVGNQVNPYESETTDVALHFNPRFRENCVIRNTKQGGLYGKEERLPNVLPITPGATFELLFLVQHEAFKVAVNGKHFIEYKHRIPYQVVGLLKIEGDAVIDRVNFSHEPTFPVQSISHVDGHAIAGVPISVPIGGVPLPGMPIGGQPIHGHPIGVTPQTVSPVLYNPPIPLVYRMPNNLRVGQSIFISGRPTPAFDSFRIDLLRTTHDIANAEVALHLSARRLERCVVRNSWQTGLGWQSEERASPPFPFTAGVNFDMMIRIEGNRFQISVNGQHFVDFGHRLLPVDSINFFQIKGDVSITSVRFAWSRYIFQFEYKCEASIQSNSEILRWSRQIRRRSPKGKSVSRTWFVKNHKIRILQNINCLIINQVFLEFVLYLEIVSQSTLIRYLKQEIANRKPSLMESKDDKLLSQIIFLSMLSSTFR